jgi:hypothetical protein
MSGALNMNIVFENISQEKGYEIYGLLWGLWTEGELNITLLPIDAPAPGTPL